jgi:uncharacterized protein YggE
VRVGGQPAGATLSHAIHAGGDATRLGGVGLDFGSGSKLLTKARNAAFSDAKAKAKRYAKLAGRSLGPVTKITEKQGNRPPQPMTALRGNASAAGSAQPVPVEPGTRKVSIRVTVVWSLR